MNVAQYTISARVKCIKCSIARMYKTRSAQKVRDVKPQNLVSSITSKHMFPTVFRTVVLLYYNLHLNFKGSSLKETKHDSCLFFILFQVQILMTPKIATKKINKSKIKLSGVIRYNLESDIVTTGPLHLENRNHFDDKY